MVKNTLLSISQIFPSRVKQEKKYTIGNPMKQRIDRSFLVDIARSGKKARNISCYALRIHNQHFLVQIHRMHINIRLFREKYLYNTVHTYTTE